MRSTSLFALTALVPQVAAASDGLDCRFTELCVAQTCEDLGNAAMRLRFIGSGENNKPAAFVLSDSRLLGGARLEKSQETPSLFGEFDIGSHVAVQLIGVWTNSNDDPRREVVIDFDGATQLRVGQGDTNNAVLTKEGRGLTALIGPSRAIGLCKEWNSQ